LNNRSLSYQDMLQIIKIFESSPQLGSMHLKFGDTEIDLDKQLGESQERIPARPATATKPIAQAPVHQPISQPAAPAAAVTPGNGNPVCSEMVGTFYRASEPGAAPFVEVGQRVSADTTICIIEVMKLMTSVPAGQAGVVTSILVEDGQTVEFGQPLVTIAADA